MLKTAEKTAYVIDGDRLYRWTATDSPKHEGDSSKSSMPIRWKYRQSAFRLADGPNTTLTHELIGAKPKDVKIELIETQEGMEIDSKTGTVVLDNNVILARAQEVIEQTAQSKFSPVLPKTIQSSYENLQKLGTQITKNIPGEPSTGIPVTVPIRVQATHDDQIASIQYYVLADVPMAVLEKSLEERAPALAAEYEKFQAEKAARLAARNPRMNLLNPVNKNDDLNKLQERIETLEARLNLMTRQLDAVLKKLDAIQKPE